MSSSSQSQQSSILGTPRPSRLPPPCPKPSSRIPTPPPANFSPGTTDETPTLQKSSSFAPGMLSQSQTQESTKSPPLGRSLTISANHGSHLSSSKSASFRNITLLSPGSESSETSSRKYNTNGNGPETPRPPSPTGSVRSVKTFRDSETGSLLDYKQAPQNDKLVKANKNKILVSIRFRPLSDKERTRGDREIWAVADENTVGVLSPSGSCIPKYRYDLVFNANTSNATVFDSVCKHYIPSVLSGINATVFAYGVTSSGKTHTMMGSAAEPGLVPQTIKDIFQEAALESDKGKTVVIHLSMMEIYNEVLNDLLDTTRTNLKMKEDLSGMVVVDSLSEVQVSSAEQALSLIEKGEQSRKVGYTAYNEDSSRSHTICRLLVSVTSPTIVASSSSRPSAGMQRTRAAFNLIDLAGSESARVSLSRGQRMEGSFINKSLLTLGTVISKLAERGGTGHIPFRDSKLTRLLQGSLSGVGARISLVCNLTPGSSQTEETHNTLKFASRARLVRVSAATNEVVDDKAMVLRLKRENAELRRMLLRARYENAPSMASEDLDLNDLNGVHGTTESNVLPLPFQSSTSPPTALTELRLRCLTGLLLAAVTTPAARALMPAQSDIDRASAASSRFSRMFEPPSCSASPSGGYHPRPIAPWAAGESASKSAPEHPPSGSRRGMRTGMENSEAPVALPSWWSTGVVTSLKRAGDVHVGSAAVLYADAALWPGMTGSEVVKDIRRIVDEAASQGDLLKDGGWGSSAPNNVDKELVKVLYVEREVLQEKLSLQETAMETLRSQIQKLQDQVIDLKVKEDFWSKKPVRLTPEEPMKMNDLLMDADLCNTPRFNSMPMFSPDPNSPFSEFPRLRVTSDGTTPRMTKTLSAAARIEDTAQPSRSELGSKMGHSPAAGTAGSAELDPIAAEDPLILTRLQVLEAEVAQALQELNFRSQAGSGLWENGGWEDPSMVATLQLQLEAALAENTALRQELSQHTLSHTSTFWPNGALPHTQPHTQRPSKIPSLVQSNSNHSDHHSSIQLVPQQPLPRQHYLHDSYYSLPLELNPDNLAEEAKMSLAVSESAALRSALTSAEQDLAALRLRVCHLQGDSLDGLSAEELRELIDTMTTAAQRLVAWRSREMNAKA